jgi:DNA-binding NtrC family response regulator
MRKEVTLPHPIEDLAGSTVQRTDVSAFPLVVVVDDEQAIQIVLNRLLMLNACLARQASNLQDVVALAQTEHIDAFLIDMTLKGGESGLDVLAWLRRQPEYKEVPVLVFTGHAVLSPDDEATIQRLRAHIFYKTDTLRLAVEAVKQLLLERNAP